MALKSFKAVQNGTLANPYRFVMQGQVVELTNEEAEVYKDSKWLLPLKKANAMVTPPLMSHMNLTQQVDRGVAAMEAINVMPVNKEYQSQINTLVAAEAAANEAANAGAGAEITTKEVGGTGNQEVI